MTVYHQIIYLSGKQIQLCCCGPCLLYLLSLAQLGSLIKAKFLLVSSFPHWGPVISEVFKGGVKSITTFLSSF